MHMDLSEPCKKTVVTNPEAQRRQGQPLMTEDERKLGCRRGMLLNKIEMDGNDCYGRAMSTKGCIVEDDGPPYLSSGCTKSGKNVY